MDMLEAQVIDAEPQVRSRLTAEEFMILCEGGAFSDLAQVELVDGDIVEMPPEGTGHAVNNTRTFWTLGDIVRQTPGLDMAANVAVRLGPAIVVAPDLTIFDANPDHPTMLPAGAVCLAIEHAMNSRRRDLGAKAVLYAEAGVPEYWVLDDVARVLHRFYEPQAGVYRRDPPREPHERVAVPFGAGEIVLVGDLLS